MDSMRQASSERASDLRFFLSCNQRYVPMQRCVNADPENNVQYRLRSWIVAEFGINPAEKVIRVKT